LENKFPEIQRKKIQAGKYAQVIRSIAKVIALGPYDKIQDPEENNITVVRNFVEKMDEQMGEELADFLKYVFPDQIRKGTADIQDEQQQMLGILTNELRKSKVLLSDLIGETYDQYNDANKDDSEDVMTKYTNKYEKKILYPDRLLERIQEVYERKAKIAKVYDENVEWIENNQSRRRNQLEVLKKKKLNSTTDWPDELFKFWTTEKLKINARVKEYGNANVEFNIGSAQHTSLINSLKTIGVPFDFDDSCYYAIFLGMVELYNELLQCFLIQLTPEYVQSGKNLQELKTELLSTIDAVWRKCCKDSTFRGLDEKTTTSFESCCVLLKILAQKTAPPGSAGIPTPPSTGAEMISKPPGAPCVLHPKPAPRWLRELQMQARPRGSFQ
jgi:hypothetical protein